MITALFILSVVGAYSIYKPFLLPIIVAMLLTMATYNLTKKMIKYFKSRKISAAIVTVLLTLVIFAPIVYIATVGVANAANMDIATIQEITSVVKTFAEEIPYVKEWVEIGLSDEKIAGYIHESTSYVTTAGSVKIWYWFLYFILSLTTMESVFLS
jgi:predicted PurR-regulated permease PerM